MVLTRDGSDEAERPEDGKDEGDLKRCEHVHQAAASVTEGRGSKEACEEPADGKGRYVGCERCTDMEESKGSHRDDVNRKPAELLGQGRHQDAAARKAEKL